MTPTRLHRRLPRRRAIHLFLRQLALPTRASALRSVVDGVVVTRALRASGVRSLLDKVDTAKGIQDVERSMRIAEAVDAALGLLPVTPTCLRRSVTLIRELDRLGLAGVLHVGFRKDGRSVEAHAWVQVGTAVVNDAPEITSTYIELASGELERIWPLLR